jgi:hypothetical protein
VWVTVTSNSPGTVWKRRVGMVGSLRDMFDEGWTVVVVECEFVVYNSRGILVFVVWCCCDNFYGNVV